MLKKSNFSLLKIFLIINFIFIINSEQNINSVNMMNNYENFLTINTYNNRYNNIINTVDGLKETIEKQLPKEAKFFDDFDCKFISLLSFCFVLY